MVAVVVVEEVNIGSSDYAGAIVVESGVCLDAPGKFRRETRRARSVRPRGERERGPGRKLGVESRARKEGGLTGWQGGEGGGAG